MVWTQIAVSPQPRIPGESVSVLHGNNFLLKVEGVTQQNTNKSDPDICASKHRATRAVFRKPKAVKLTVISTPIPNPRTLAMMEHLKVFKACSSTFVHPDSCFFGYFR